MKKTATLMIFSFLILSCCKNKTAYTNHKERFNFCLYHIAVPAHKYFSTLEINYKNDTSYCLRYMDLDSNFNITKETISDTIHFVRTDSLFFIGTIGKTIACFGARIDMETEDSMVYYQSN